MINRGKHPILGVNVHAVDYEAAVQQIVDAAASCRPYAVSALAVHGVMTGYEEETHRRRLNGLDLVVPDGQPVRWALNWMHGVELPDRVYGPNLTLYTIEAAAEAGLPVYFYGSTEATLGLLVSNLKARYPELQIAGFEASKFRRITPEEKQAVVGRIKSSGTRIVFAGLGCPRQETWAFEYRDALSMPILAVGAAFDFHAGSLPQAPKWMQDRGLEWLFRLKEEPKRLWRRYLVLNPKYLAGLALVKLGLQKPAVLMPTGEERVESYG
ncbi:MAG: WecB/TagA/CpsF family glycosyltransferase [Bacteroidota bacterium]